MAHAADMKIAVLDADDRDLKFFNRILKGRAAAVYPLSDPEQLLPLLESERLGAVVISLDLPNETGLALVHHVGALHPEVMILVTASPAALDAVSSARALGAQATLFKPLAGDDVLLTLDQAEHTRAQTIETIPPPKPKSTPSRPLSLLRRGQELLACERIDELLLRLVDIVYEELDAEEVGIWISQSGNSPLLLPKARRGEGKLQSDMISLDQHEHAAQLRRRAPFTINGESSQLWVPLCTGQRFLGLLIVDRKLTGSRINQAEAVSLAEIMSDFCITSLHNLRRLELLEQTGIKDPETSAYTFTYFADFAGRQLETSKRHAHRLSIATLIVEQWNELSERFEPTLLSRLSSRLVEVVLDCIRDSDMIARIERNEYCLIFPETGTLGALTARRRLMDTLSRDASLNALDSKTPLGITLGVASFPNDGEDLAQLMQTSHQRAAIHRKSPLVAPKLKHIEFWTTFDELLGAEENHPQRESLLGSNGTAPAQDDPLRELSHVLLTETRARHLTKLLLDELCQRRDLPGICYVHAGLLVDTEPVEIVNTKALVYVFRPKGLWPNIPPGAADIQIDDARLMDSRFILFLGEAQRYGLIGRAVGDNLVWALHFADMTMVDELINRLQQKYYLQHSVL